MENQSAEIQDQYVSKQETKKGAVESFTNYMLAHEKMGIVPDKANVMREVSKTTQGVAIIADERVKGFLSDLSETAEGRVEGINQLTQMKNQYKQLIFDKTGGHLTPKEIEETYFAALSIFDNAIADLDNKDKKIADILKNRNIASKELDFSLLFNTPEKVRAWTFINEIHSKVQGDPLMRIYASEGNALSLKNMYESVLGTGAPIASNPPPLGNGVTQEDQKSYFRMALEAFGFAETDEEKRIANRMAESMIKKYGQDMEGVPTSEVFAAQEMMQDPAYIKMNVNHGQDAAFNLAKRAAIDVGINMGTMFSSGSDFLAGTGGGSLSDMAKNIEVVVAKDGTVSFRSKSGESSEGGDNFITRPSLDVSLNRAYAEEITTAVRTNAHGGHKDQDYIRSTQTILNFMAANGGPVFTIQGEKLDEEKGESIKKASKTDMPAAIQDLLDTGTMTLEELPRVLQTALENR